MTVTPFKVANSQIVLSGQLFLAGLALAAFNTQTNNPIMLPDSTFSGESAGGSTVGNGTEGITAGSFANTGAETGTGSNQGGLGTATPYPAVDWGDPTDRIVELQKQDGDQIGAIELDNTVTGDDAAAPVFGFLSYRSDASSNQKWRIYLYYIDSTGAYVPLSPNQTINNVHIRAKKVFQLQNLPVAALSGKTTVGQSLANLVIGNGAIGTNQLATGAVTAEKIGAGEINNTHVNNGALSPDKITLGFKSDEFANLSSASSVTLTYSPIPTMMEGATADLNGVTLHYGSAADANHFTISGNILTFGAAVTGNFAIRYAYNND
jgi:hypothetical protein